MAEYKSDADFSVYVVKLDKEVQLIIDPPPTSFTTLSKKKEKNVNIYI